ncbi:MAG TPA: twin-arginine translocase subunit TatC [Verrucomicrobiae bacterium]
MVDEPEAERLETEQEEEEEGGPVKSFLEHLEDLRWVLIKSLAFAGVAVLACLLGGNYVVDVLKWPLTRAPARHSPQLQTVRFTLGTNQLGIFRISTNEPFAAFFGTNKFVQFELEPVVVGTNLLLGANVRPDPKAGVGAEDKLLIDIINLGPAGAFIVATKVAVYAGLVVASPFIFYFVAAFVFPALKMREKKYVYRGLGFGAGLFLVGVAFCYFILMPIALAASAQYAQWLGFTANQWRAEDYISFVCKFMLGMGLGFELPVVVLTLVKIGVLNYAILTKARRYVIVINFVLGAVLTTPEVITQILMAVPLQLLYEVSVWIAWYWERKAKKREAAAAQAECQA